MEGKVGHSKAFLSGFLRYRSGSFLQIPDCILQSQPKSQWRYIFYSIPVPVNQQASVKGK